MHGKIGYTVRTFAVPDLYHVLPDPRFRTLVPQIARGG
jgi:hypothetical protein